MKHNWKKNTAIFLSTQALSLFGSSLVQYAIMWHITLLSKSGVYATIAIICGFLPTFFLSPFAGVWADRHNRKKLIMLADGFIAACTLILAIIYLTGYKPIWLLFVALGIRALGTAVQTPCVGAILPSIVPEEKLTRVNGINGSLQSLIMLASPMLSAVLLNLYSIEIVFFVDVITAAAAISVLMIFLKIPTHKKALENQNNDYISELKLGINYILRHKYLRNFFMFCAVFFLTAAPAAFLTTLQVVRVFGEDTWRLVAIEIVFSMGMLIGGLFMASWGGFRNRIHSMSLAGIIMGVSTVLLGFPYYFTIYLSLMFIVGLVMPLFNTPAMVLLQERVDPDFLGRVFGVMTMISSSMMPIGMLIFGPIADIIQIELILVFTGVIIFLASFSLMKSKSLLKAGANKINE